MNLDKLDNDGLFNGYYHNKATFWTYCKFKKT